MGLGASAAGGSAGARLGLNGLALWDLGSGAHAYGMALGFAYECDIKKAAIYGFQDVSGMIGGGSGMRDLGTLDDLARGAKRLWWDEVGSIGRSLPVPKVADPTLENLVGDLYKGARNWRAIGTGSTADAIRNEIATGIPTGGKFHARKGLQYMRALQKWLSSNPQASHHDRLVAQAIYDDLEAALNGR